MKTKFISILIVGFLFTSCSTVEEKLEFETDNLVFKIIQKNTVQGSVKFFKGFYLNSKTGQFEPNSSIGAPTKGNVFVTFKFNIMSNNVDTIKINSESDYKVQTSNGEDITIFHEMSEYGFISAPFTSVLPPNKLKEYEFLLAIPKNKTKGVKFFYKDVEGAVINF